MLKDHMYMNGDTIREAEKTNGAVCDICRKLVNQGKMPKELPYDEHKQALLVGCLLDIESKDKENKDNVVARKELFHYMKKNKKKAEKNKMVGFAFVKRETFEEKPAEVKAEVKEETKK
jgi:hypothetical protein